MSFLELWYVRSFTGSIPPPSPPQTPPSPLTDRTAHFFWQFGPRTDPRGICLPRATGYTKDSLAVSRYAPKNIPPHSLNSHHVVIIEKYIYKLFLHYSNKSPDFIYHLKWTIITIIHFQRDYEDILIPSAFVDNDQYGS
jgi:hypothetical protein